MYFLPIIESFHIDTGDFSAVHGVDFTVAGAECIPFLRFPGLFFECNVYDGSDFRFRLYCVFAHDHRYEAKANGIIHLNFCDTPLLCD